jgi:hypothetical protein
MLHSKLQEFERCLLAFRPSAYSFLQPGLDQHVVEDRLNQCGIRNDTICSIFTWHNGVNKSTEPTIGDINLFAGHWLYSLDEAIDRYRWEKKSFWGLGKSLFPIFNNGEPSLFINVSQKDPFIYYFNSGIVSKPKSIYDSFETMIETVIELYSNEGYVYDTEFGDYLDNRETHDKICQRMNPNSKFWK